MTCRRCGGLMVAHRYFDLDGMVGAQGCECWRCVNCGDLVDGVVLEHRSGVAAPAEKTTRRWPRKLVA